MTDNGRYHSQMNAKGRLLIQSVDEVEACIASIRRVSASTVDWLMTQPGDPLMLLRRMKFEAVGRHPIDGHALNFTEILTAPFTGTLSVRLPRKTIHT